MKIFLTGATGFVGSYVLKELVARGHQVRCLVRGTNRRLSVETAQVEKVEGDIGTPESLKGKMFECDAVIHLVGIIDEKPSKGITFEAVHFKGAEHVINEASREGVERFVLMSANGARPDGVSEYQTTKWKAEEYLKNARFSHWTIFRPSLIFGDPGPDNPEFAVRMARQLVKPFPALPVFGRGDYLMAPISVEEVASAFAQAVSLEKAHAKTYCAAGKERMTYVELLDRITEAVGHARKPKIPQPIWLVRPAVHALGRIGLLPITPDQFEMLIEGNACDSTAFYADFELTYRPFRIENLHYIRRRA